MGSKRDLESLKHLEYSPDGKMKAVVWEGKVGKVTVQDVDKPKIKHPTDAIVRLTASGICGTDLHIYHGIFGSTEVPYVLGHEGVGYVVEVGPGVESLKVGQRVIVPDAAAHPVVHLEGDSFAEIQAFGLGPDFGNLPGLQSEYTRCPLADETLIVVPDKEIPDKELIPLSDIFATAWGGLSFSDFQPGDSVAIFGAGPVGLLAAYSAILRGASIVYSIDHIQTRLDKAKSIGAIPIDFTKGDPADQILKERPLGVKRVLDCIGEECLNEKLKPEQSYVINKAIKVAAFQGGIGVIGVYTAEPNTKGTPKGATVSPVMNIDYPAAWLKMLSIKCGGVDPFPIEQSLFQLILNGRAKPSFVFSNEYRIDEAPQAYRLFDKKKETKPFIRFPWAGSDGCDVEFPEGTEEKTWSGPPRRKRRHH